MCANESQRYRTGCYFNVTINYDITLLKPTYVYSLILIVLVTKNKYARDGLSIFKF